MHRRQPRDRTARAGTPTASPWDDEPAFAKAWLVKGFEDSDRGEIHIRKPPRP